MAHTEQLGTLNESASKRLKLATKGVIQQYLEAQIPDIDEHFKFSEELSAIMLSFMWQNITREQAAEKLEVMKKELWDKRGTNERWDKIELHQITNHPLYQQTIKDILSEDIYLQYKARQTERENYRIQVSRDFILAYIEVLLLPNETQMKQLKTIAAQLTSPSLSWEEMQLLFAELLISMDPILLKLLQQGLAKGGR